MSALKPFNIDLDDLASLMDVRARDTIDFYLDAQTGEIITTGDGAEVSEEIEGAIEAGDDRFVQIPENDSRDSYAIMEDFIATIESPAVAERLQRAIEGKGAFSRFRREVASEPELCDRWYQFESEQQRVAAVEWLESLGITSTWTPPPALKQTKS